MSGSLIKIDEFTVSSAVASITIGGGSSGSSGLNASIDSTYDVYVLIYSGVAGNSSANGRIRFTESGTANTTANYDEASQNLRSGASFSQTATQNATSFTSDWNVNAGTEGGTQNIHYIFNASNSSEFTFISNEQTGLGVTTNGAMSFTGGGTFTVASAVDGVNYFMDVGSIDSGKFALFGLKK